jgi:hypothetical protein
MHDKDTMAFRLRRARGDDEDVVPVDFNEPALVYPFLESR